MGSSQTDLIYCSNRNYKMVQMLGHLLNNYVYMIYTMSTLSGVHIQDDMMMSS